MKKNQLVTGLLTGIASLALVAPLAINQITPSHASRKWITITTNYDQLMFAKPGSRRYQYSNHNKGLKIINKGIFRYRHRLYYRVQVPAERNHIAYILASQTNFRRRPSHKIHSNARKHRYLRHHTQHRINKRRYLKHKQFGKKRSIVKHRRHLKVSSPKMSSSQWYTTSAQQPVKDLKTFNDHIKSESLKDIIQDRTNHRHHKHYVTHLRSNRTLNKLADLRAKQTFTNFSHFETGSGSLNNAYFSKDAKRLGLNPNKFSWGENISRTNSTSDPSDIADQLNNGYMNNDAKSDWSHRDNILNSHWTQVGIGSYHDNQTNETYQSELFAGK